jgi:glycosyltransferase involved in cell wall biosynthesis
MRILVAHNRYQQAGGEDAVFHNETRLLEAHGHEVVRFDISNDAVGDMGRLELARATLWNRATHEAIARLLAEHRPDVAHFHNTFPLLSPSAYDACRSAGVPVVQTLHNYRLLCAAGTLYRAGGPCESCLGRLVKWPGVAHACYRGDRGATAVATAMLAYHHARGTYRTKVDRFIALTEFAKRKFVAAGIEAARIVVKGNSVPDTGVGPGGDDALFVGRLAPEKGIATMLAAWRDLGDAVRLRIVGDGPLREDVSEFASRTPGIEYLGRRDPAEVAALMRRASFLVFPSEWYETFGLTIAEAFACGTPVVAARLGAAAEIVTEGVTGRLFAPGDADALRRAALHLADADPRSMRAAARAAYEADFTPERNVERLVDVYGSLHRPPEIGAPAVETAEA